MFNTGERVRTRTSGEMGTITSLDGGYAQVMFDDDRTEAYSVTGGLLEHADSVPGPSAGTDIVHAAMLRHAVNAGSAVTALEIIRREAKAALAKPSTTTVPGLIESLDFIEKFADDVLSQVLPA